MTTVLYVIKIKDRYLSWDDTTKQYVITDIGAAEYFYSIEQARKYVAKYGGKIHQTTIIVEDKAIE